MKFYRPTKTDLLRQLYGEKNTFASVMPIYKEMGLRGHDGFDFQVNCADPYVRHGGKCEEVFNNVIGNGELEITYIQRSDEYGYGIVAMDKDWNKFLWWHFDIISPLLYVGAKLNFGDLLGTSGDTGKSTGAHVHFAWYKYGDDPNNGYKGAGDPEPYYDNRFCLDIKTQISVIQKMIDLYKAVIEIIK